MEVCRYLRLGAIILVLQTLSYTVSEHTSCTPGFDSELYVFKVDRVNLHIGRRLGKVVFNDCTGRTQTLFNSVDKRFKVDMDGTLTLKRQVTLHDGHKRFSVHAWDSQGRKHTVALRVELDQPRHNQHQHLHHPHQVDLLQPTQPNVTEAVPTVPVLLFPKSFGGLRRRKRDWIIPVIKIAENTRGPFPELLVQIKTSHSKELKIVYSITGAGADQPPLNLFTIDAETGTLYITQPLDREKHAHYLLLAHAVSVGGTQAEDPMELKVIVIDQNDNKPAFTQNPFLGSVAEATKIGTGFMKVVATNADEPKNVNSDIRYKILSQVPLVPNNAFSINPVTGEILVNSAGLDKEKISKYTLEIQAADMEGEGLTADCKAIITVTDSNDLAPQFEKTLYTVSVPENKVGEVVVKMPVTDGDDPNTPAWATKFKIISGDSVGMFSITTGPNKQEGIITTAKPLDFEAISKYTLVIAVENEVDFAMPLPTSTAQVVVNVGDVNEAPFFSPAEKRISQPENVPKDTNLVLYSASDPDTAKNQKLTYKVGSDPAGWLSVNEETGMIKVKNEMDRKSTFVKDGQYKALILAMDDDIIPATGTGTLIIQLEDVNDNPVIKIAENTRGPFPELLVHIKTSHSKELKIVYSITGAGADQPPVNLFTIDAETGMLYITQPLDSEKQAHYLLFAHAVSVGGSKVEDPMELKVIVIDQNDNKPVFAQNHFLGSVAEASKIGTEFMEVVATDADEPKNCNSNVRYTILSQDPLVPNNAFSINPVTGKIMLNSAGLDKEKNSVYILEIQAADMEGWGLTAFCKAIITVTDSNDQAPQFEKTLPPQPYVTEAVPTVPVLLFPKSSGGL